MDSGASHIFIKDKSFFWDYHPASPQVIHTCDHRSQIVGYEKIKLPFDSGKLFPAKHTPTFDSNLISHSTLTNFVDVKFSNGFVVTDHATGELLHTSTPRDGLYPLQSPVPPPNAQIALHLQGQTAKDWHKKLGHPGKDKLIICATSGEGVPKFSREDINNIICTTSIEAGAKRAPLCQTTMVAERPLELTHTDLTGPINPPSLQGSEYIQVLVDDTSRASTVNFLSKNTQFFGSIRSCKARAENESHPNRMYRVRLDVSGENRSDDFVSYANENGMILQFTPPYAINPMVSRKNSSKTSGARDGPYYSHRRYHMNCGKRRYLMRFI